ncbi:MAG: hypothetical protein ACOX47_08975 [Bacillota bacterium]
MWVLDEATSHLDLITEREVMKTLIPLMEGKTVIIISHRYQVLSLLPDVLRLGLS